MLCGGRVHPHVATFALDISPCVVTIPPWRAWDAKCGAGRRGVGGVEAWIAVLASVDGHGVLICVESPRRALNIATLHAVVPREAGSAVPGNSKRTVAAYTARSGTLWACLAVGTNLAIARRDDALCVAECSAGAPDLRCRICGVQT